jgi:hypothetical protein
MAGSEKAFWSVKALVETGLSDYEIARRTGVNRSTVLRWRRRSDPPLGAIIDTNAWEPADPSAYCYLLGCYLGDGHVTHKPPNGWTLRVACDRGYPGIIGEIRRAMESTFAERGPRQWPASAGASDVVSISHPAVGIAFPQHGPGRKHLREICLVDWQRELTHLNPGALIRGLIHSDGCRVLNRFKTKLPSGRVAEYSYVRYFFTNHSAGIREIFSEHCELLDIRVTQSNHRNLTVSHRKSVAVLETLVGPKY